MGMGNNRNFQPPKDLLNQAAGKRPTPEERYQSREDGMAAPTRPAPIFGPPDFENDDSGIEDHDVEERDFHDREELRRQYEQFNSGSNEEYEDEYDPELEDELDEDGPGFVEPPPWNGVGEHPTPPSLRQRNANILRDEPLFPGGPMRSEINAWKKKFEEDGHTVNMSQLDEENIFIWRTLARTEYREIMALPNTDPLQREEIICEVCVLWPRNYNFATMASRKAGVPAVIAEQIMHESGFKKPTPPQRL